MPADTQRRKQVLSLMAAAQASPTLASLAARAEESARRLQSVLPLIPPALRNTLQAGPIEDGSWCLLVTGNAAAAKLRQLLPALEAHLRSKGAQVRGIRLKVLTGRG